jgi:hypothetical protein
VIEMMHAAFDVNMPHYASAIVTTDEIVDAISSLQRSGLGAQTVAIGHSQGDTRQRSYR